MSRYGGFRINRILTDWSNRKSSSASAAITAPASVQDIDYSKTQGIWTLKSTTEFPKQAAPVAVTFSGISGAKGEVSGNITLPAITSDQMIVFMERANSTTPPTVRAGFTSINTASIASPGARSIRLQYRIGGGTETITTATAASYFVLNNAKSIGVNTVLQSTAAAATTVSIPALSGTTADGKSLVYTTSYFPSAITAVGAPYTVRSGVGGYVQNVTTTSIAASTFTTSSTGYSLISVIEFRP